MTTRGAKAVGDPIEADAAALRVLANTLSGIAKDIDGLSLDDSINMPGLRIGAIAAVTPRVVLGSYKAIGSGIRDMGDGAAANATSYEETEQAFRDQL